MTTKCHTRLDLCTRGEKKCCKRHCQLKSQNWNSNSRLHKCYYIDVKYIEVDHCGYVREHHDPQETYTEKVEGKRPQFM